MPKRIIRYDLRTPQIFPQYNNLFKFSNMRIKQNEIGPGDNEWSVRCTSSLPYRTYAWERRLCPPDSLETINKDS